MSRFAATTGITAFPLDIPYMRSSWCFMEAATLPRLIAVPVCGNRPSESTSSRHLCKYQRRRTQIDGWVLSIVPSWMRDLLPRARIQADF